MDGCFRSHRVLHACVLCVHWTYPFPFAPELFMVTRRYDAVKRNHWIRTSLSVAVVVAGLTASFTRSSVAQNFRVEPVYGYLSLQSPFTPDPTRVSVAAGGHVNARDLDFHPNCRGFFNPEAPHIVLDYQASSIAMQVYVSSAADTTLIIRSPDGTWHCDDDSLAKNPAVRFATPKSGAYAIWVGAFGGGRPQADIFVTER